MAATTTQRFDRLVPNAVCRLVDVNEHLLCALCSGYLVDATTIIECLHTFCRSCIIRYLESSETCPVCDVPLHQTNPLLGIRSDTTLQSLVYKLVPGVYKEEVKRRCSIINNAYAELKSSSVIDRLLKDICDMTTGGRIYTGDEMFSITLQHSPSTDTTSPTNRFREACSKEAGTSTCEKPRQDLTGCSYLLCPASLTVGHLKKLIRNKLELSLDLPVELYHSSRDGCLEDCYSMADVAYITAWTSVKPLHFFYRVNAKRSRNENETNPRPITSGRTQTSDSKPEDRIGSKQTKSFCPSAKGKLSKSTAGLKVKPPGVKVKPPGVKVKPPGVKVKPPPGRCLAKKSFAIQKNLFSSKKPKENKNVGQEKSEGCLWKGDCAPEKKEMDPEEEDEEEEEESVILLEEDTLESFPTQTDPALGSDPVEPDLDVVKETDVKRAFSDVTADSALSPSRHDVVTQSTSTTDNAYNTLSDNTYDALSDVEGNDIDSASSPQPPKKKTKMADLGTSADRNLFAVINSMKAGKTNNNNNNNDNVVSSSTSSSQVSGDDSSDSSARKTSVETQTNAKFISRKAKKSKIRSKKETPRPAFNTETQASPPAPLTGVTVSAHTSTHSTSVTAHSSSSTPTTTTTSTTTTVCVPICMGDKGSSLILSLPQNVSVQCRIRSDKIVIASSPTVTNPETALTAFSSISHSETITIDTTNQKNNATLKTPEVVAPPPPPPPLVLAGTAADEVIVRKSVCNPQKCAGSASNDCNVNSAVTTVGKKCLHIDSIEDHAKGSTDVLGQTNRKCTEQCLEPRDMIPDTRTRDRDGDVSVSLSTNALSSVAMTPSISLPSNASRHSNGNTVTSDTLGHSFSCGDSRRQSCIRTDSRMTDAGKPPPGVATKPPTPDPNSSESRKPVPRQKPVQPVLPNVSKLSTPAPPKASTVETASTSANKVVLFKPYQMATTTSAKSPTASPDGQTVTTGSQHRQSTSVYPNSQFPLFPGFSYAGSQSGLGGSGDADRFPRLLTGSGDMAEQKPSMAAMHCMGGNIPLRNVLMVPIYTATGNRKKSEKKTTPRTRVVQGQRPNVPQNQETFVHSKELVETSKGTSTSSDCNVTEIRKTSMTSPTSHCVDSMATRNNATETKDPSLEERTPTKNSVGAGLKLPFVTGGGHHQTTTCTMPKTDGDGREAPLADDSQITPRKIFSSKRQRSETPRSPRRRSEKSSALDDLAYTRAEADSETSPGTATGSPPRCGSSKSDGQREDTVTHHHQHHRHRSANDSPVRKKLVIDLERCKPSASESTSPRRTSLDRRLQCCSPTTTLPPPAAEEATPVGQIPPPPPPPTKLVISLPRCQVPPTTQPLGVDAPLSPARGPSHWSPPSSSSGGNNSPPTTTKRLKLMCNGMTIYRTLESPGSRSRTTSGEGEGVSGARKSSSPVSAGVLDCLSSALPLLNSSRAASKQGRCRRKSVVRGAGDAVVVVGGEPSIVVSVDSTSTSPRSAAVNAAMSNGDGLFAVSPWRGLERSLSMPDPERMEEPLELTTKVVKERQKEREYEKMMFSLRPPTAFTT